MLKKVITDKVIQLIPKTDYYNGATSDIPLSIILNGYPADLQIVYVRYHKCWMVKYQADYRPDTVPLAVHGKTIEEAIDKMYDVLASYTTSEQGD